MESNNKQITFETIDDMENTLICDIRANLEGIGALASVLHMVADPEGAEPLMDAQTISCAIFGLEMAVKNLDASIDLRHGKVCQERATLYREREVKRHG